MAVYGLTRASMTRQEQSPEIQADQLRQACMKHGEKEPIILHEKKGTSGTVNFADRPQGKWIIENLTDDDTLIVSKLDRLGRVTSDILNTINTLSQHGIHLLVLQFCGNQEMDLKTPLGRAMVTFAAAFAQFEREMIAQRTSEQKQWAIAHGYAHGRPPFGFMNVRLAASPERKRPSAVAVPVDPEIIDEIITRIDAGESHYSIAKDFFKRQLYCKEEPWSERRSYGRDAYKTQRITNAYRFWKKMADNPALNGLTMPASDSDDEDDQ